MPASRTRWIARVALAGAAAALVGYVPHRIYSQSGLRHLVGLRQSLGELRRKNASARTEHLQLRAEAAALKDEPRAIEQVARDGLGLVKEGEVLYQIEGERP